MNNTETLEKLESLILEPKQTAEYSIIWLHGLGADGHDFAPIVPELKVQDKYHIRFVFPHAPKQAVTLNNGYVMPAWFDIYGIQKGIQEDKPGIAKAYHKISTLIEQEHAKGIAYSKILLAGFSMGGALALYTGLKYPHQLAGIIGLSCYLFRFDEEYSAANKDTPIMLAHGTQDPIVLPEYGYSAKERLEEKDYNMHWYNYPMAHSVCAEEISDIANFIDRAFSN